MAGYDARAGRCHASASQPADLECVGDIQQQTHGLVKFILHEQ